MARDRSRSLRDPIPARDRPKSLRGRPIPAKKRQAVYERSGGRCEAAVDERGHPDHRCLNKAEEIQHALPRSRGGYLLDAVPGEIYHLIHLCRPHHRWAERERAIAYTTDLLIAGDVNWDKLTQRPVYRGPDPYLSKEYPDGTR